MTDNPPCGWVEDDDEPCGAPSVDSVIVKDRVSSVVVPVCNKHRATHHRRAAEFRTSKR